MASDDDKPRGRGSDDERPGDPASERTKRSDPFDEDPPVTRKPRRPSKKANDRAEGEDRDGDRPRTRRRRPTRSEPKPEVEDSAELDRAAEDDPPPRRRRFSFRRRDPEPADADRREVARLSAEEDDELADLPEPPRLRRPPWWMLVGGGVLVLVAASALYGEFNTERYFLVCSGSNAAAHRGRGFPWPFGHQAMVGAQYKSVSLGGDVQCQTQELDSEAELRFALLKLVLAEAERLSHKTRSADLARARRLVNQGTLLARNHKKERQRLAALRATLDFQQARVVMRELETTLEEAKRLFVKSRGRSAHKKEAAAWIRLLDRMLDQLRRRIAGDPVAPRRVGAPPDGTPDAMAAPRQRPVPPVSGGTPTGPMKAGPDAPPMRAVPQPPPDAGVTGGGILL